MEIQHRVSLRSLHTFGTTAVADHFAAFQSAEELSALLEQKVCQNHPVMLLGGGSNVLFVQDPQGVVLANRIMGKEVLDDGDRYVLVRVGAGEIWHDVVKWSVANGWGGLENLSLIPGRTGAAPMQNIGAYGVELERTFHELEAMDLQTGKIVAFGRKACEFGYRESIFKRAAKGQYAILSVSFRLDKQAEPNLTYGAIQETLQNMGVAEPSIADLSKAVMAIRRTKLPDPAELGNAGSFFKNPELTSDDFAALLERAPEIPSYPQADGRIKVPAGWLIEQAGWKGKRHGETGAHAKQALVLVNYGHASGAEIWAHAQRIQASVNDTFGVQLQPEVNVIGG